MKAAVPESFATAGDLYEIAFFSSSAMYLPSPLHLIPNLIIFTTKEAQVLEPPFVSLRKR